VVVIPLAMWATVRLLVPDEGLATGLLLVAIAAAGPLGIKLTQLAGGDVALAIGLVVLLQVGDLVVIPAWSSLLGITTSLEVVVDIVRTLLLLLLLPLGLGVLVARLTPERAVRFVPPASRVGTVGLLLVVALVLVDHADSLGPGTAAAIVASLLVVLLALGLGWWVGGPSRHTRITAGLTGGVRANGAAFAVASTSLAGQSEVLLGVVVAGIVSIVVPSVVAGVGLWVRRRSEVARGVAPEGSSG
jgi:BASS family bile acid:Na+ symporter